MTVSYTGDVANGSSFGCFWKILGRYGMDSQQRQLFEKVKVYASKQIESIPMSFVLGFYVTLIVKRWWDQYWLLPLPDNLALYISSSLHGQDERGRIYRRTIMRYTILAFIITLQRISFRVKKRFPTLQHLVDAGLMMDSEKKIFDKFEQKTTVSKFWMPCVWASNLVNRARLEGRLQSDHMYQTIIMELSDFRRRLGRVMIYDTVSVPLVYTQVVTLAVYTYFIAALIGRQWVHPDDESRRNHIYPGYELDLWFPIFLSLQFIFYVGWLKVAETLINPFGEDDDDFELNWLIDRHIQVSYMVVDEMHEEHPELLRDQYWEQVVPAELPYNLASGQFRRKEPQGSTASMKIKHDESVYDNLPAQKRHSSVIQDEVYADLESVLESPPEGRRKSWIQRQLSRVESFRSTSSNSSLFSHRNKLQHRNSNGGVPNAGKHNGSRMSFYEKIMNRRSSKEIPKNSPRVPPSRALANGGHHTKDTLMLPPHSRPRVPTPDVAKETQIMITSQLPENNLPPIKLKNPSINPNNINISTPNLYTMTNVGNGNVYGGNTSIPPTRPHQNLPSIQVPQSPRPMSPQSNDLSGDLMLSPIEENDGSPYSTSSTNRSSKSYPTTTSIFGRKPSPPPPKNELPPIPSEETRKISRNDDMREALCALDSVIDSEGVVNDGFEDDDPYQTISEVGDAKEDYIRNIPNIREYHNGRRLSKEKQELMLQKLKSLTLANKSSQVSLPISEQSTTSIPIPTTSRRNSDTSPSTIEEDASSQSKKRKRHNSYNTDSVSSNSGNNSPDDTKKVNVGVTTDKEDNVEIKAEVFV